ncbi:MAG: LPS export ABC transporter permease LptF [Nitrospirota bacterium]
MRIIDRYIIKELVPPFLLGLLLFTFVLLINRIFKLTDLIVAKGVPLIEVLRLVSYIMPSFLTLTIPMSLLLAALVAFGRLSTDSEIVALKATGFSIYRLMMPVLALSLVTAAVTAYFSLYLGPHKARNFKRDVFTLARTHAFAGIEEGVFNDSFKNLVIYANKVPAPNEMKGVFISDERDPNDPYVIIARRGVLSMDMSTGYAYLNLKDGSIHRKENKSGSYQEINFANNTLSINLYQKLLGDSEANKRDRREMSLSELRDVARQMAGSGEKGYALMTEYYSRFTIPLACIVFGLVGPPLGMFSRRSGKSSGLTLALVIFTLYYLLMKGGEDMANAGNLPPFIAAILPNFVIGSLGIYLVVSAGTERSMGFQMKNLYNRFVRGSGAFRGKTG